MKLGLIIGLLGLVGAAADAQTLPLPSQTIQSGEQALAQDASQYMLAHPSISLPQAMQRLQAQQDSVSATDRLQERFKERLAGISIEHEPEYRIIVLLIGDDPVPDETIRAAKMNVPVIFRTGAKATRQQVIAAMRSYQPTLRTKFSRERGMGHDPRTGKLAVYLNVREVNKAGLTTRDGIEAIRRSIEVDTGVPVSIKLTDAYSANTAIAGGARVEGVAHTGRRGSCTTAFVVTDGLKTAMSTAAHCPDELTYHDPQGGQTLLSFVNGWGWGYQDVQINASPVPLEPLFYANPKDGSLRTLETWRNRTSTRAGDYVCHYGIKTGYSCAEVEMIDFAPPRDLCAGPCQPEWITVAGPKCGSGDSGGPVFNGNVAFGILKGAEFATKNGKCHFYFYMSTDRLPGGWSLLHNKERQLSNAAPSVTGGKRR